MGRFGRYVIDADGHGGEPLGWRTRIPTKYKSTMRAYVDAMRARYKDLPGGGMRVSDPSDDTVPGEDLLEFGAPLQPGMYDAEKRMPEIRKSYFTAYASRLSSASCRCLTGRNPNRTCSGRTRLLLNLIVPPTTRDMSQHPRYITALNCFRTAVK